MATQAGRFKIEWHGEEVLRELRLITGDEEMSAAKRIEKRLKKYVPVRQKPYPPSRRRASGYYKRSRGTLRRTIRISKSRFRDGGYIVLVGDKHAYYAYWVEKGTVYTFKQKFGRRGEKYMHRAGYLETQRFIRQLKKRVGAK